MHSEIGMAYSLTVSSKNNLVLTNNGPKKVLNCFENRKHDNWKNEKVIGKQMTKI